ncbi:MAG: amphi-Trp domain-containing protein [Candidatus Eisenbacteria bacterium]
MHESLQDVGSIVAYLDAIREGFLNGTLSLRDDAGDISLKPSGLVRLQIDSTRKRDRVKLAVRLAWKEDAPGESVSNGSLVIGGAEE